MMGRGDWRKLEAEINAVLEPMGERIKALEERVEALEAPKTKAPVKKSAPAGQKAQAAA